jgi:nucleotide-binding universal stress UspA family protein
MKTILAATDFSEISKNAINYAVEMAKITGAKLILFHSFHVPVVTTDVIVIAPALDELEKNANECLLKLKKEIELKEGNAITIECIAKLGFAVDEINEYTKENKIDLVVLGMHGAGFLTEKLIGSITTSLLHDSNCPVLAIDQAVKFVSPKKIAFACDYKETDNKEILEPLKEIVNLFKSHIYVLNVINESGRVPKIQEAVHDFIKLEDSLSDVDHSLHYIKEKDVVAGINAFVSERKMDMTVMIPRHHSILENILKEPTTKKMAFHTKLPLLALH